MEAAVNQAWIKTNKEREEGGEFKFYLIVASHLLKSFKKIRNGNVKIKHLQHKKKFDQNISLVERQSGLERNLKLTEFTERFILGRVVIIKNNT